ncbi:MAG: FAD-dependent oxidoreductase, partial [Chloroflexi bacterium]|nr:FAD-dependent oxidoreductase [Chloroflexota bacterium]
MKLFDPIKVGGITLKNRTYMLSMGSPGQLGQRAVDYYVARAKGGTAALVTGIVASYDLLVKRIEEMRPLVDQVHEAAPDCKIAIQPAICGKDPAPVSPSGKYWDATSKALGMGRGDAPGPVALTKDGIKEAIEIQAESAYLQKKIGFDFLEFHGTHAYVLRQFFSPQDNKRDDEYGGSLENRMRFPLEVVRAARQAVGNDFAITYKMPALEEDPNGITLADSARFAMELEKAGVDALVVSQGLNMHPKGYIATVVPLYASYGLGSFVDYAEFIRKWVSIPVVAVGRIVRPDQAEAILEEGKADIVGLGRQLIADPDWANKAQRGAWGNIAPCQSCNSCLDRGRYDHMTCAVNARAVQERETEYGPAQTRKRVMVVGSGPGGMETARIAAERGHDVTIYEKGDQLGGLLRAAAQPVHKEQVERLRQYLVMELGRTGVKVKLNTPVDAALVKKEKPDAIVVATGSRPRTLNIPGVDRENVIFAEDALLNQSKVGKRVLVVGGGMVGLELAETFAKQGKAVYLVEILEELGRDLALYNKPPVVQNTKEAGVVSYVRAHPEEITAEGVKV